MDQRLPKSCILHACFAKQQMIISDFENEVNRLKAEVTFHYESASQSGHGGSEQNELLVRMEHELLYLKNELITLEGIDPDQIYDKIQEGAVVVTDYRIFFVSTSIETMDISGKFIFGLSTHAPIYTAMKGKGKGEFIEFSGLRYQILDVY